MKEQMGYEIGLDIFITSKMIHRYMDSTCPVTDLNGGQIRVIATISKRADEGLPTFQKDIEAEFGIRRSTVTSVLQNMEKNGYIERIAVPHDARLKKLVLTKKGEEADKKLSSNIFYVEEKLKAALSDQEIMQFRNIMNKLKETVNKGGMEKC